jgi:uncharacterized RDD family membrane protein YckC
MELLLFVTGMIALLGGRVVITNSVSLEGDKARIFGGFLVAPWIIAFASGVVIGNADPTIINETVSSNNGSTGFYVFWGCVAIAFLYALGNIWKSQSSPANFSKSKPATSQRKAA